MEQGGTRLVRDTMTFSTVVVYYVKFIKTVSLQQTKCHFWWYAIEKRPKNGLKTGKKRQKMKISKIAAYSFGDLYGFYLYSFICTCIFFKDISNIFYEGMKLF